MFDRVWGGDVTTGGAIASTATALQAEKDEERKAGEERGGGGCSYDTPTTSRTNTYSSCLERAHPRSVSDYGTYACTNRR